MKLIQKSCSSIIISVLFFSSVVNSANVKEDEFIRLYGNDPHTSGRWEFARQVAYTGNNDTLKLIVHVAHTKAFLVRPESFIVSLAEFGTGILVFDEYKPMHVDLIHYTINNDDELHFYIAKGKTENGSIHFLNKVDKEATTFRLGVHVAGTTPEVMLSAPVATVPEELPLHIMEHEELRLAVERAPNLRARARRDRGTEHEELRLAVERSLNEWERARRDRRTDHEELRLAVERSLNEWERAQQDRRTGPQDLPPYLTEEEDELRLADASFLHLGRPQAELPPYLFEHELKDHELQMALEASFVDNERAQPDRFTASSEATPLLLEHERNQITSRRALEASLRNSENRSQAAVSVDRPTDSTPMETDSSAGIALEDLVGEVSQFEGVRATGWEITDETTANRTVLGELPQGVTMDREGTVMEVSSARVPQEVTQPAQAIQTPIDELMLASEIAGRQQLAQETEGSEIVTGRRREDMSMVERRREIAAPEARTEITEIRQPGRETMNLELPEE